MQPDRFDSSVRRRLQNFNPGGREKLWKAISNELDSFYTSRKRKLAFIPYLFIAGFIGMGVIITQDDHFLKDNSLIRAILNLGHNSTQQVTQAGQKEIKEDNSGTHDVRFDSKHGAINSEQLKITAQPIALQAVELLDLPVGKIDETGSSSRILKKLPQKRHQTDHDYILTRSAEWDNVALAGRGHKFVAAVGTSMSRSPGGITSNANFAGAALRIAHSSVVVSILHSNSFNEFFAGTQTTLRVSTAVLKKSWGKLYAGAGIGYLTRRSYKMAMDLMPFAITANVEPDYSDHHALGMETGIGFVGKHLLAGFSVANFNHPRLAPTKFEYHEPLQWEATAAWKINAGNVLLCPNVSLRSLPSLNADLILFAGYKSFTAGAGLQEMNWIDKKVSPSLYAGIKAGKRLDINTAVTFTADNYQPTHYGLSSSGNIISLGLKYSLL